MHSLILFTFSSVEFACWSHTEWCADGKSSCCYVKDFEFCSTYLVQSCSVTLCLLCYRCFLGGVRAAVTELNPLS